MLTTRLLHFAESLMRTPAAPFREDWMCAALDALLEEIPGLEVEVDAWGNRHATVRPPGPAGERAPLVLVAHLDHPGFLVTGVSPDNGGHRLRAVFEGRVFDEFFPGGRVRVFSSPFDAGVPGRVVSFSPRGGAEDNRQIEIETEAPAPGARIAMWDLPAFEADAAHIRGRACDDLCGAAAILAALDHLARHADTLQAEREGVDAERGVFRDPRDETVGVGVGVEVRGTRGGVRVRERRVDHAHVHQQPLGRRGAVRDDAVDVPPPVDDRDARGCRTGASG